MQISPEINNYLTSGGVGAILVLQTFIYKKLSKVDAIGERTLTLENTVFGPTKDNGLRGDVKDAKEDIAELQRGKYTRRSSDIP